MILKFPDSEITRRFSPSRTDKTAPIDECEEWGELSKNFATEAGPVKIVSRIVISAELTSYTSQKWGQK